MCLCRLTRPSPYLDFTNITIVCVCVCVCVRPPVTYSTSGVPQVTSGSISGTRSSSLMEMIHSPSWSLVSVGGTVMFMYLFIQFYIFFLKH